MSASKLEKTLIASIEERRAKGTLKGRELVIAGVKRPSGEKGYRYLLEGFGDREFLKMNQNAYLGMNLRKEVIDAEEEACRKYGAGPGAVRFINGTFEPHVELEKRLARFHGREAAMIFSSAYATMIGTFPALISDKTALISDELNHNCIINAIRLSRPQVKEIYKHLDMADMEQRIKKNQGAVNRVVIVTDGIFSMRGDYAPLDQIARIAQKYDDQFPEGCTVIVDDSHGVGAFGRTGRGVEEYTGAEGIHVLIGTLGKAFGVNGGYITASAATIEYLRESAATYIYSNPITPSEAAAALTSLEILDSPEGLKLLEKLRTLTRRFEEGLVKLGFEIIASEHPVVPLMVRDTRKTAELVKFLTDHGVLATGLNFPVVPRGDEEIRFQVSAAHTEHDIDYVLDVLKQYQDGSQ
ncbi:MAG: aminotransferase class I/II-fold pyridoxal phosphate-dependent enzyme [Pirellulales bacterium]|nr:aminotransferase class I/II-fold pyridoxal phosphate-dependent enzyme [Pirellulales bacterium]